MQLFITDEQLDAIRTCGRRGGTLRCAQTDGALFTLGATAGPTDAAAGFPELRASRDTAREVRLPWLVAELPPGPWPKYLVGASELEDPDPFGRWLSSRYGLPHLPGSYQPYIDALLHRGRRRGIVVVSDDDVALLSCRATHTPPDHRVWYRNEVAAMPVTLSSIGSDPLIAERSFVVLGAGSLGSRVAEMLAAAGAAKLVIVDPDILEPRNLRRHLCGMEHLGRPKAEAVADELARRGFPTEVTALVGRAQVDHANAVREAIQNAAGVVCTTDSAPPRQLANHCAVHAGVASIVANVQLRPEPLAEIVTTVPNTGGCFNCWRVQLEVEGIMLPPEGHDAADYPDAGSPSPSGLPLYQLALVASAACDLLSDALASGARSSKWMMALDGPVSSFPDLADPKHVRLEGLDCHPQCEVC